MHNLLFYVIVAILIFDFVLERSLDFLNATRRNQALPEELTAIYQDNEYQKSQRYKNETTYFGLISDSFSFVLILLMILFHGFAFVDTWVRQFSQQPIVVALLFFGILFMVSNLVGIPFALYSTFVIEEKYGFNKMNLQTFILDTLKGWLLAILIGGLLISVFVWFYNATAENFWIYAWITASLFMVFMATFYSSLIVPLFNKQTPLENGELKNAIQDFCHKVNFKLDTVFVIDGSKRSTKANAYFSGLGSKKRIVLYDTLIKDLTINEILAVLAHEIGHYKHKHIQTGMLISVLQTGLMFYILSLFVGNPQLSQALGASQTSFHLGLITFGILFSPLSRILGLIINALSRKNEYQADHFAAQHLDSGDLISALKKLTVKNFSNLTPHPAYVIAYYSHPTLLQRIRALKK